MRNQVIPILFIDSMPDDVYDAYRNAQDWRIQNDTCIAHHVKYLEPDGGPFERWLFANFDLSGVDRVIVDMSW